MSVLGKRKLSCREVKQLEGVGASYFNSGILTPKSLPLISRFSKYSVLSLCFLPFPPHLFLSPPPSVPVYLGGEDQHGEEKVPKPNSHQFCLCSLQARVLFLWVIKKHISLKIYIYIPILPFLLLMFFTTIIRVQQHIANTIRIASIYG